MENSILEALADNRLVVKSDEIEETEAYRRLKKKEHLCVEACLKIVGEDRRPDFESWLSNQEEYNDAMAKDSFLYGFRFGALSTIEVCVNRGQLFQTKGKAGKRPQPIENRLCPVLEALGFEKIFTSNPGRLSDPRSIELSEKDLVFGNDMKALAGEKSAKLYRLIGHINAWDGDIMDIKTTNRFICGYSLGVSLIEELFQDRDLIINQ